MSEHKETPVKTDPTPPQPSTSPSRLNRLKTAFLYVLIGALAAAAITSVIALLVGQFSSSIAKALLTILVLFTHSLIILAILTADRFNQVGRLLLPTAITVVVFASIVSTTLGIWEIISAETAWRALSLYFFVLGAVFIIIGLLRLRLAHQATQIALYTAIGFIVATILAISPWVLQVVDAFDPLYFRIVAALSILATTSFLIGIVIRGIALAHNDALKQTTPAKQPLSGGLLAIYIVSGVLTAIVWCVGFTAFLVSGVQASNPTSQPSYEKNRYY